ncbi:MAG: MarR family winged helix-turn-helix transcriptional regulator [Sphaerochaetaceae bacterium]
MLATYGTYISILYRKASAFFNAALKPLGLSAAELPFLMTLLRKDGMSQEQLSTLLDIDKAATARVVRSLERKSLVIRVKKTGDRRYNYVYLSELGRLKVASFLPMVEEWNALLVQGFAEEEKKQLLEHLQKMAANVGQKNED